MLNDHSDVLECVIKKYRKTISLTALDVPILHSLHHHYYFHKGLCVDDFPASVVDPDHPATKKIKSLKTTIVNIIWFLWLQCQC